MTPAQAARIGILATTALLLAGRAAASDQAIVDDIAVESKGDAVLVKYRLGDEAESYDVADVRVSRNGRLVRLEFPDARLRGRKRWPKAEDPFVRGSYAHQVTPSSFRHKLRLADGVDVSDIALGRFGDVIVARLPKSPAGKDVPMAPEGYAPARAVAAAAPAPAAEPADEAAAPDAGAPDDAPAPADAVAADLELPLAIPAAAPEAPVATAPAAPDLAEGRRQLLEDLLATPARKPEVARAHGAAPGSDLPFYGGTRQDAVSKADPLGGLAADLPAVNPLVFVLVIAGLGLLTVPWVRKARLARLGGKADGRTITVLDRKVVAGKTGVALLEAAGRLVLVGTSDNGLTPLADLGPSDDDFHAVVSRSATPVPAPAAAIDGELPAARRPAEPADEVPAAARAIREFRAKVAAMRTA